MLRPHGEPQLQVAMQFSPQGALLATKVCCIKHLMSQSVGAVVGNSPRLGQIRAPSLGQLLVWEALETEPRERVSDSKSDPRFRLHVSDRSHLVNVPDQLVQPSVAKSPMVKAGVKPRQL